MQIDQQAHERTEYFDHSDWSTYRSGKSLFNFSVVLTSDINSFSNNFIGQANRCHDLARDKERKYEESQKVQARKAELQASNTNLTTEIGKVRQDEM